MTIEKFFRLILGLALTLLLTRSAHAQGTQPLAKSSPTLAGILPPALQSCNGATPSTADMDVERRSIYVPASDGIKLAVDIFLPKNLKAGTKLPTLYSATRYWRARKDEPLSPYVKLWTARGYAVVNADVRGTGASFGQWYMPYSPVEARDVGYLANWIATQPWSNGKVVMTGTSYTATTALVAPAYGAPALKAIAPKFSDFDGFADLQWPGGVATEGLILKWGGMVRAMDLNQPASPNSQGVRPVDGPDGDSQLAAAIDDHRVNPWPWDQSIYQVTFKDEPMNQFGGMPADAAGVFNFQDAIYRSHVPIFGWGSWLDSGIAQGMVNRFMTWTNPQIDIIGPWTHGARQDVNVFTPNKDVDPSLPAQELMVYCFLNNYTTDHPAPLPDHILYYYTMGEDRWKETTTWPIAGTAQQRFYLAAGHVLSDAPPAGSGQDLYTVDFSASPGPANRWATQSGGPRIDYGDRAIPDQKLLVYTSPALGKDMEMTGQPVITLRVASNQTDGNFFAYVEDVAPDGKVTYVTEGVLRALHRNISTAHSPYRTTYPYRTYSMHDAELLVPGQTATLTFQLQATSVLFRTGHRVRLALAGADSGMFLRIPAKAQGPVTLTVNRGGPTGSFIDLPIVPARPSSASRLETVAPTASSE
jgi:putative CocE/NonD family hydrolase